MANTTTYAERRGGLADRIVAGYEAFRRMNARRAEQARVRRELIALSDRELSDIGISRRQIPEIAAQAARDL